ncbi:MAG: alpha/beta hydrolase, partial [Ilyomonas sp.]
NDTAKRVNEDNPYDNEKYGKGEGKQFTDFLANTLKPFVDKQYRTLKDVKHTYIAGSSMGGLISLYAVMEYPQTFGAVGVFSPAFWIAPQMFTDMHQKTWTTFPRFYFYAGGKETETMVSDMKKMYNIIAQKHNYDMQEVVYSLGQHNESYWRKEFPNFYKWLVK